MKIIVRMTELMAFIGIIDKGIFIKDILSKFSSNHNSIFYDDTVSQRERVIEMNPSLEVNGVNGRYSWDTFGQFAAKL